MLQEGTGCARDDEGAGDHTRVQEGTRCRRRAHARVHEGTRYFRKGTGGHRCTREREGAGGHTIDDCVGGRTIVHTGV